MKLAIDLGGTHVRVGLVDGDKILETLVRPCPSEMTCEESVRFLTELAASLMRIEVKSIGIGVPSVVDSERGIVYNATNIPSWKEVHLKEEMEKQLGIPAAINNDSNCFALGEYLFASGKPFRNLIGITLGTGTGAGVILDGKLYSGSNTGAGEIGSLPYLDSDFEAYCSSNYFTRVCGTTGKTSYELAVAGDENALHHWSEFGVHLGNLAKAALFAYDPQAIIWGGGLSAAYPLFEAAMWQTIRSFPYPETVNKLYIGVSQTPYVSLLGASALINDTLITN